MKTKELFQVWGAWFYDDIPIIKNKTFISAGNLIGIISGRYKSIEEIPDKHLSLRGSFKKYYMREAKTIVLMQGNNCLIFEKGKDF
jgi:hypothetical protein